VQHKYIYKGDLIMLNYMDFTKLETPAEVIAMQANLAKTALAYIPNEDIRAKLSTAVEVNAALATAVWDAFFAYGDALKTKVLTA
jgi:hypothetical protein